MDLFIQGKGRVSLGHADFVAQGGQGAVYVKGDLAFKVYLSPGAMIPPAKIQELAALTAPNIVRPDAILLDGRNHPVGYTMRRIPDSMALCQIFTRAFRERQGVMPDKALALVRSLQAGIRHVHTKGMLIVDLHEMNFLVDKGLQEVWFIDVDSYQTPGFPATVQADSIRDRHTRGFNPNTDWFSFGIVSFQMFIGIHPYRGKHPTLTGLDERMQANVSVLNRKVTTPAVCYPLTNIPSAYLDWYRAIFEQGKRLPPPDDLQVTIVVAPMVQRLPGSDHLEITRLGDFPAEIVFPILAGGPGTAVTAAGLLVRGAKRGAGPDARIALTPRLNHIVAASLRDGRVRLVDVTDQDREVAADLAGEALMAHDGRTYVRNADCLFEVEFVELPAAVHAALRPVGNVLAHATQLFDGVAVQSLMGAWYASVFPAPGTCRQVRIKELDGYRVVDARFDNNVLMIVGARGGRYDRFVLRFDAGYRTYDLRIVADIAYAGLNFVTLDNGICVHLNENEDLELFSNKMGSQGLKTLADPALQGVRLFKNGTQVLFARGDTLYRMAMKPGH